MAKRWYSVSVLSNFEKKVAEQIRAAVAEKGLEEEIDEVLVPTEEVLEIRRGKKVTSERRFMPGYVLVRMDMTDESWGAVRHTPGVTQFVGQSHNPVPLSLDEVVSMLAPTFETKAPAKPAGGAAASTPIIVDFEVGEQVKVIDGPFDGFSGMVEEVDEHSSRLKVTVSIFGRPTPVELEFTQVQKVA